MVCEGFLQQVVQPNDLFTLLLSVILGSIDNQKTIVVDDNYIFPQMADSPPSLCSFGTSDTINSLLKNCDKIFTCA